MIARRRWVLAIAAAVAAAMTLAGHRADAQLGGAGPNPPPNGLGLTYRPMPDWFEFQNKDVVQGWIERNQNRAMIEHAWALWGGLSSPVEEEVDGNKVTYPTFETWVDELTVFPQSPQLQELPKAGPDQPRKRARPLVPPRQLVRARGTPRLRALARAPLEPSVSVPLVVTVKYTKEIYDHVRKNHYDSSEAMDRLNESWDKNSPPTPLARRSVEPFPDTSIMLKPTYQVVSGRAASLVPYWTGPANSTTPGAPGPASWTSLMLFVPPGVEVSKVERVPVVRPDQFYHFRLNRQEAEYLNAQGQGTFSEGDYALLVAMHVSSREIDDWTWQTFWWSIDKPQIPRPAREHIKPPFDHYEVAVGYSFTTGPDSPAGLNILCFNPYLEAGFDTTTFLKPAQLGIESNCMSCHRTATWPLPANQDASGAGHAYYIGNGIVRKDDPYFKGTTKTDFLWGLPEDVPTPKSSTTKD